MDQFDEKKRIKEKGGKGESPPCYKKIIILNIKGACLLKRFRQKTAAYCFLLQSIQ